MPSQAKFDYPPGGGYKSLVNVLDILDVSYESQWDKLNLTLFCLAAPTGNTYAVKNVESNPILPNGTFRIFGVNGYNMAIHQYPTICHYKLTEYQNNSNYIDGAGFNLTSTAGTVKTFAASVATTLPTQSATSTGSASITSLTNTAATSTSTSATSSPPQASSGLSTGAKAGIGIGVALGVILVLALIAFFFLRKRRQSPQPATVMPVGYSDDTKDAKTPELHGDTQPVPYHEKPSEGDRLIGGHTGEMRAELPG